MSYQMVENEMYKTVVVSEGIVVTLFSGELVNGKNLERNLRDFINYINKSNVTKVHLIFGFDKSYSFNSMNKIFCNQLRRILKLIYNTNPNVRVSVHVPREAMSALLYNIEYVRRDAHYKPRIVTDIDSKKPLYFRLGYKYYKKITRNDEVFKVTIVDKMYN